MEVQRKRRVRRFLARLLLVTMLLGNLQAGRMTDAWATSDTKTNSISVSTASNADDPEGDIELYNDLMPTWQNRLSRAPYLLGDAPLASASVASPSEYGIEIEPVDGQVEIYVNSGYYFALLAKYDAKTKPIEPEVEDAFWLVMESVAIPEGGTYTDITGAAEFKPKAADVGKVYTVNYVVKYYSPEGVWKTIEDIDTALSFTVANQEEVESIYDFVFNQVQPDLLIGKNYDLGALATISCDDLPVGEADNYRIAIKAVTIPEGGTYEDVYGNTEFTPKFADENKEYKITYVVEYTDDDGATWKLVKDQEETFTYKAEEAKYGITIDGVPAMVQVRIDKEYKFINSNMSVVVSPSQLGDVTFELVVDRMEKPANGTYTFTRGDEGFTPKANDKDLSYNVIYQVIKHYPTASGRPDEVVMDSEGKPLEAVSVVTAIGEGVRDAITSDDAKIDSLTISISDGTGPWDGDSKPGNDKDNTNRIIRSYDTITYTLNYTAITDSGDSYKNARYLL